jgi:hypothetical protein
MAALSEMRHVRLVYRPEHTEWPERRIVNETFD